MVHVGKVWISVAPDLKGFREKVEKELRSLRGMKVQVNPDLDGFRREVKDATKGLKATVDVDLDTKGIKAEAKAAAKAASGEVVSMKADLDTSWADKELKEWGKRFSKRNATGVTMLKVDVDRDNISNVEDLIHKQVSRTPVNIEMQIRKDRLMQSIRGVQKALRKQVAGQSRYIQLSLGTSPKDSRSQRKMLSYLDQVKSRIDKLKKDTTSPWEQWDGKSPIKEFHTSLAELNKDIKALRDADEDSWKLGNLSQYNHKLTDQTKQLKTIIAQHRQLVKESQASGKAFPDGFRKLTEDINKLNQELDLAKKNFGPDFRQFTKDIDDLVKRRTRREIFTSSFLDSRAVQETKRQLDNLHRAYDSTTDRITSSNERIRQSTRQATDSLKELGRTSALGRAMSVSRSIDLGGAAQRSGRGLAGTFRESTRRVREAASGVRYYAYEMAALKIEAQEAASANDKVAKSLRNTARATTSSRGFGARRKGLRSIDELGTKKFAGLSRVGWIVSAIGLIAAPVIQLVSGLVAALPALGGVALAALGVTLLGLEGIKDAAQAAAPALERVKSAVSDVFRERMTSQFEQLGTLLDNISPQLQNMANGMSDFSQGLTDGLTSTTGTANIQKFLDNTAGLFSGMKPFATDFTEGLLEMAAAGSETFPSLADGMNRFGDAFRDSIGELSDSGQLQDSIQATYDVVGSFGTNIGRILREGIETAPEMVEGVTTLFDGIADGVIALMGPLSTLSGLTFTGIGSALSGLATDIENTSGILAEHAPTLETDIGRITKALGKGLGTDDWSADKGFIENLTGKPAVTEAEAERIGNVINGIARTFEEAPARFRQSMSDMKDAWADFFSFLDGGDEEGFQVPFNDASIKATDGIKKWWDEFKMLFSEEGRAKIKELSADPELNVGSILTGGPEANVDGGGIAEKISSFFTGLGPLVTTLGSVFTDQVSGIFSGMGESISTAFSGIGESISGVFSGISSTVVGSLMGVVSSVTSTLGSLPGTVSGIFSNVSSVMSSSFSGAASAVSGAASSLVGSVSGTLGSLPGTVSGIFSSVMSTMTGLMSSAAASVIGTISGMVSSAVGILASLPGQAQAALGNVGGVLVASGRALVQGFISGITSMIGSVISAAGQVAAAARSVFPFSPAKRGPLSGKGYTTYSGKALVKDFAKGIESEVSVARAAATLVAKATQEEFNSFQVNPTGNMEGFKRQQVLQPVLESNAKKIADYRKREAERAEKFNERMGKIDENKSKADKKEEQRAEARKDLAKQSAEAYEKLLESLDTPDYGKIDRSFKSYWMDGYSQVFKESIANAMSSSDFTGALAKSTKGVINQIRQQFGDHPILSQVEAQVDTEAFHWAIYNAIEESGIHEIPINLVVSNVDQLKSDLGMGDGVLSRALDAVLEYDPAQTDGRRYEEQKKEVHYHVADMEEAIRLEQQRERKEMMKLV